MSEDKLDTFFAPAQRSSHQQLFHDVELISGKADGSPFLDASPALFMVLNANREIVHLNESVGAFLGISGDSSVIIGKRPGEAFKCENACKAPNGCGTGLACGTCGAVIAILECLESGRKSVGECQLCVMDDEGKLVCLNLRVSASPLKLEDKSYVVFCASDIGDELRRNYLEGVFIHELRNSAGNLLTLGGLLKDECSSAPSQTTETASMLYQAAEQLMSEIDGHRILMDAETGRLKIEHVSFSSMQLLQRLMLEFSKSIHCDERRIELSKDSKELAIYGDPTLLTQILCKLIQNALEATPKGGFITVSSKLAGDGANAAFEVWNSAFIKRNDQMHIFHRHFSTKGGSKGIGTYMARLLAEKYLGGKISFISSEECGTTFRIEIPLRQPSDKEEQE